MKKVVRFGIIFVLIFAYVPPPKPAKSLPVFTPVQVDEPDDSKDAYPYYQWYCDDPREQADVIAVIYNEGTDQELVLAEDPDACDSELARRFR